MKTERTTTNLAGKELKIEENFSDFRLVDGIKSASRIKVISSVPKKAPIVTDYTVLEIEYPAGFDETIFAKP